MIRSSVPVVLDSLHEHCAASVGQDISQRGLGLGHLLLVEITVANIEARKLRIGDECIPVAAGTKGVKGHLHALAYAGTV